MEKKNLLRIDAGRVHGWQVRIVRSGEQHTNCEWTGEEVVDTARPAAERLLEVNDAADAV